MTRSRPHSDDFERIEAAAADWVAWIDRGLTAEEQDAYTEWLAQDPRHREAVKLQSQCWAHFDRLAGLQYSPQARVDPDLLAPTKPIGPLARLGRLARHAAFALPMAAALAFAILYFSESSEPAPPSSSKDNRELPPRLQTRTLEDGSTVILNRDALISVAFTENQRHVSLLQGEATFTVAKDPQRPFSVDAAGVDVRAIGTIFNVKLDEQRVDVIVTEGQVRVSQPWRVPSEQDFRPFVEIGQRARVTLAESRSEIRIEDLQPMELERELRWQPQLLDFDDQPLLGIVEAFNQRNSVQLAIADPSIRSLKLSTAFWSDNLHGFLRLIESTYDIRATWASDSTLILSRNQERE